MTLLQTRDILTRIQRLHEQLALGYARLDTQVSDPRARLLLDYLGASETATAQALRSFTQGSADPALKEWEPIDLDDARIRARLDSLQHPDLSTDELLEAALEVAEWIEALYARAETSSTAPEQRALFANLREHTAREKRQLARNANMLGDI